MADSASKRVWFPLKAPLTFKTLLMRLNAKLLRGRLVWVRNHKDMVVMTVAYRLKERDADGRPIHIGYYFWPMFRKIKMHDDGRVTLMSGGQSYLRHWIEVEPGPQTFQMMKNSDVFKQPLT